MKFIISEENSQNSHNFQQRLKFRKNSTSYETLNTVVFITFKYINNN